MHMYGTSVAMYTEYTYQGIAFMQVNSNHGPHERYWCKIRNITSAPESTLANVSVFHVWTSNYLFSANF